MVTISVSTTADGYVYLKFPYGEEGTAEADIRYAVKKIPGVIWSKADKAWVAREHALRPMLGEIQKSGAEFIVAPIAAKRTLKSLQQSLAPLPALIEPGRPYQKTAAERALSQKNFMLAFDMRVGKTLPTCAALATFLASVPNSMVVLLTEAGLKAEWDRQLPKWTQGLQPLWIEGRIPLTTDQCKEVAKQPYLILGVNYETMTDENRKGDDPMPRADLLDIIRMRGGRVMLVGDEVQALKNRKAPRVKAAHVLSRLPQVDYRLGLTGTPMRNKPADLWAVLDFLDPGMWGSFSSFGIRYADGHQGDYGWEWDGESNVEELKERLAAFSYRLTRRDVAQWLPKTERSLFDCALSAESRKKYDAMERVLGRDAIRALQGGNVPQALKALEELSAMTLAAKMSALVTRAAAHRDRGAKVLVGAYHHDSLRACEETLSKAFPGEVFTAGGWMTPERRDTVIAAWKAAPAGAVLCANMLSSGRGLDFSEAGAQINVEIPWVPADLAQWEARIQDVHNGTRVDAPIHEYLLARHTIDEDRGLVLIEKMGVIERVIGADAELSGLSGTLRAGGLVSSGDAGLENSSAAVVEAAMERLRARLMGQTTEVIGDTEKLAVEVEAAFTEEPVEGAEPNEEDIPF